MAEAVHRPVGVAIVAVLAGLSGLVDIFTGILLTLNAGDPDTVEQFGGSGGLFATAVGQWILGTVVVILSFGIWTGRWVARMVVTVLQVLSLISSLFLAVANLGNPVGEWASLIVSFVVLILLWTRSSSAFFRPSEVAAG